MSARLDTLLDADRRADCAKHDAADRAMDARMLHRIPAPNEGRGSEASRRASCAALGLNPDAPLALLASPGFRFTCVVVASWAAAIVLTWWGTAA